MTKPRKKTIPDEQLATIVKIAKQVRELRQETGLSIERFCSKYEIPRITYGNLESGKSGFQITTLLSILACYSMTLTEFIKKMDVE